MSKPETKLRNTMKASLLHEVGGKWFHVHGDPYQERGVSDLIGCVQGWFIAIEVKMLDGKPATEYQLEFIAEVKDNGGLSFVSDNVDHAVTTVKEWLKTKGGVTSHAEAPQKKRGSSKVPNLGRGGKKRVRRSTDNV